MTPRLVLSAPAEDDLVTAAAWYEEQRAGLGLEFTAAIRAVLHAIERTPLQHPVIRPPVRRALARRFPYAIYFVIERDAVVVLACLHVRRDPTLSERR